MGYLRPRIENLRHRFLPRGEADAPRPNTSRDDLDSAGVLRSVWDQPERQDVQSSEHQVGAHAGSNVVQSTVDPGIADALDWWARARLYDEQTQLPEGGEGTVVDENGIPIRKYRKLRYDDIRRRT